MTDKNVLLILDRAFADGEFRCRLEADLEGTVRSLGLELSDQALAELMTALDEGHDFATGLDQRLSQSGFALNPASLIRQKGASGKQSADLDQQIDTGRKIRVRKTEKHIIQEVSEVVKNEEVSHEPLAADEMDIEIETE